MTDTSKLKKIARESLLGNYGTVIGGSVLAGLLCTVFSLISVAAGFFMLLYSGVLAGRQTVASGVQIDVSGFGTNQVLGIVCAVVAFAFLFLTVCFTAWLDLGKKKLYLEVLRGEENDISDVFYPISRFEHSRGVVLLRLLTTLICLLPYLIPLAVVVAAVLTGRAADLSRSGTAWHFSLAGSVIAADVIAIILALGLVYADVIFLEGAGSIGAALEKSVEMTRGKRWKILWTGSFSFILWVPVMIIAPISVLWLSPYMRATVMALYLKLNGELEQTPSYRRLFTDPSEISVPEAEVVPAAEEPVAEGPVEEVPAAEEPVAEGPVEEVPAAEAPAGEDAFPAEPAEAGSAAPAFSIPYSEYEIPVEFRRVTEEPHETEITVEEGENHEMPVL